MQMLQFFCQSIRTQEVYLPFHQTMAIEITGTIKAETGINDLNIDYFTLLSHEHIKNCYTS